VRCRTIVFAQSPGKHRAPSDGNVPKVERTLRWSKALRSRNLAERCGDTAGARGANDERARRSVNADLREEDRGDDRQAAGEGNASKGGRHRERPSFSTRSG
jgi:hypothetical protein